MLFRCNPSPRRGSAATLRLRGLLGALLFSTLFSTTLLTAPAHAQTALPPGGDARSFFQSLLGDWVGVCVQTNDGERADDKYFHAAVKQAGPNAYQMVLDYYRLDRRTGVTSPVGISTITTTIGADGSVTNRVSGRGEVMIDDHTSKPESHDLSEGLRLIPGGAFQGTGDGRIDVSGMPMGAGKGGQVRNYRSLWSRTGDTLSIQQQLDVKFKVLCFSKSMSVSLNMTASPGNDLAAYMRKAGARVDLRG